MMDFSEPWESFVEDGGTPGATGLPVADSLQYDGDTVSSEGDPSSWEGESDAYFYENPNYLEGDTSLVHGIRPGTSTTTESPMDDSFAQIKQEDQPWFVPRSASHLDTAAVAPAHPCRRACTGNRRLWT